MVNAKNKSKIMLGVGTALAAISIGLVMQAFVDGPVLDAQTSPTPPPELEVEAITLTSSALGGAALNARVPSVPDALPSESARSTAPLQVPEAGDVPAVIPEITPVAARIDDIAPETQDAPLQATPAPKCEITMEATALPAAMVELSLNAPCLTNERFVMHHSGMMFSAITSDEGTMDVIVPALTENAVFIASFVNGNGAVAQVTAEGMADVGRVVVQWRGESGLGLHAREYGAEYFAEGHVHLASAGSIAELQRGSGGVLQRYGDMTSLEPLIAEVYSYPISAARTDGSVSLSVEAEITQRNCEINVEAQTLELRADGPPRVQDLTLYMPDCEATGDFLVLKNLLEDMTLAAK